MDISRLNRESHDLLERLADRFPAKELEMCREFDMVGERNELVDVMCAVLIEWNITITVSERDALAALLNIYPLPIEGYEYINNREQTLADVAVAQ